ncbi:DUF2867 domain-containing protein [Nocardia neocaledoniensis]|uniref:Uncharacterized protein DUF2867 n=1 Tax=Nocardia neocaledoniensis TaxID=236511 RepID=A0A317NIG8_9NOCA|nr:DUF2867 domain-containing protein [Nocardia neocaledoniensis]PWV73488.1 uncharacterized protein DUF2867 [Nocardia neocaledoniensis]
MSLSSSAPLAAAAIVDPDYVDEYSVAVPPGASTDPAAWTRAIFGRNAFPDQARSDTEHLTGKTMPMLEFVASVRVVDGTVTLTTVVRYRNRFGRIYFALAGLAHRRLVPRMMTRARRRMTR